MLTFPSKKTGLDQKQLKAKSKSPSKTVGVEMLQVITHFHFSP